jgi:hypothetical protein
MEHGQGRSAFDELVDSWPDGSYVRGADWGEDWLVVISAAGRNDVTDAVRRSFPHAFGGGVDVVVCSEFVAELCAWYSTTDGPIVDGVPVSELDGVGRVGPDALVSAVAKLATATGPIPGSVLLSVVRELGTVASGHDLTLPDGAELVRVSEAGLEVSELDVVLSVVGHEGSGR